MLIHCHHNTCWSSVIHSSVPSPISPHRRINNSFPQAALLSAAGSESGWSPVSQYEVSVTAAPLLLWCPSPVCVIRRDSGVVSLQPGAWRSLFILSLVLVGTGGVVNQWLPHPVLCGLLHVTRYQGGTAWGSLLQADIKEDMGLVAADHSVQWLSVKEETIFLYETLIWVTDCLNYRAGSRINMFCGAQGYVVQLHRIQ